MIVRQRNRIGEQPFAQRREANAEILLHGGHETHSLGWPVSIARPAHMKTASILARIAGEVLA